MPHTSPDNTLSLFHLEASYFDEQRTGISLQQVDLKLHRKECDQTFSACGNLVCYGQFCHVYNLYPSWGDELQSPASEQGPSLKNHLKTIRERPLLKNYRDFSSAAQAVFYLV